MRPEDVIREALLSAQRNLGRLGNTKARSLTDPDVWEVTTPGLEALSDLITERDELRKRWEIVSRSEARLREALERIAGFDSTAETNHPAVAIARAALPPLTPEQERPRQWGYGPQPEQDWRLVPEDGALVTKNVAEEYHESVAGGVPAHEYEDFDE